MSDFEIPKEIRLRVVSDEGNPLYPDGSESEKAKYDVYVYETQIVSGEISTRFGVIPWNAIKDDLIKHRVYEAQKSSSAPKNVDIPIGDYWASADYIGVVVDPKSVYQTVSKRIPDYVAGFRQKFVCERQFPRPKQDSEWKIADKKIPPTQFVLPNREFGNDVIVLQFSTDEYLTLKNVSKSSFSYENDITDHNIGIRNLSPEDTRLNRFTNEKPKSVSVEGTLTDIYNDGDKISKDDQLYKLYRALQNRNPFIFYSNYDIITNSILTGIDVTQSESSNSYDISLDIKEIDFYEPRTTAVSVDGSPSEVMHSVPIVIDVDKSEVTKQDEEVVEGWESDEIAKRNLAP